MNLNRRILFLGIVALLMVVCSITGALAYEEKVQNADGSFTTIIYGAKNVQGDFSALTAPKELEIFGYKKYYDFDAYKLYFTEDYGFQPILLYLPQTNERISTKLEKVCYLKNSKDLESPTCYDLKPQQAKVVPEDYSLTYYNLFEGVDLRYKFSDVSIGEDIILQETFRDYIQEQTPKEIMTSPDAYLIFVFSIDGKTFSGDLLNEKQGTISLEKSYWQDAEGSMAEAFIGQLKDTRYLFKGIPLATLTNLVYPVIVDPVTSLGQSAIAADVYPQDVNGNSEFWIRWDVSSVPAGATVLAATQSQFITTIGGAPDNDATIKRVASQTWVESDLALTLAGLAQLNSTAGTLTSISLNTYATLDVTAHLRSDIGLNNNYATTIIADPDEAIGAYVTVIDNLALIMGDSTAAGGAIRYLEYEDHENSRASSQFPSLSVTYDLNLTPFFKQPFNDRTRRLGAQFNVTCNITNNLTATTFNSSLKLLFSNGSNLTNPPYGLNQSSLISCNNLTTNRGCEITWQVNVTQENEENLLMCQYNYTIGPKTSAINSANLKINNINTTNDLSLLLSSSATFQGGTITADMRTTIISEGYSIIFLRSNGAPISGCAFNSTTPATESVDFFQTCNVPGAEALDNNSQAVFYLTNSPQNNVTTLFNIISATSANSFFLRNLTATSTTFLGDDFFVTTIVQDINNTFAVGECCVMHFEDAISNVTVAKSNVENIDGEGKCRVHEILKQIPFLIDTSYRYHVTAYECNNPTATYANRKYGTVSGSFSLISHVTENSISYPKGLDVVAGLDKFQATFNFTNNYGHVLNTLTHCYYVDGHEQDFHLPELETILSTVNIGTVQQTYGSEFPSFNEVGSIFNTGAYVMECLIEFKGDSITREIRRFRTTSFNVTSTNDSILLLGAVSNSNVYAREETGNIVATIFAKKSRRIDLEAYLEKNVNGRKPSYHIASLPNFLLSTGATNYSVNFTIKDLDNRVIEDGEYVLNVRYMLEDGFADTIDVTTLTVNSSIVDIHSASLNGTNFSACQSPQMMINYSFHGPTAIHAKVHLDIEDIDRDYYISHQVQTVEFEPNETTLIIPVFLPYGTQTIHAEIETEALLINADETEAEAIDAIEADELIPQLNITANLTRECLYLSQQKQIEFETLLALENHTIDGNLNFTQNNQIDYRPFWNNLTITLFNQSLLLDRIGMHLSNLVNVTNDTNRLQVQALGNMTQQLIILNDHERNQSLELRNISRVIDTQLGFILNAIQNETLAQLSINGTLATQVLVGQNVSIILNSLNTTTANQNVSFQIISSLTLNQTIVTGNSTGDFGNLTLEIINLDNNLTAAIRNSTATNQNFYSYVINTLHEPIMTMIEATDVTRGGGIECTATISNAGIFAQAINYTIFVTGDAQGNVSTASDSASGQVMVNPGENRLIPQTLVSSYGELYCVMDILYDSKEQIARQKFTALDSVGSGPQPTQPSTPTGGAITNVEQPGKFPTFAILMIVLAIIFGLLLLRWIFKKRIPRGGRGRQPPQGYPGPPRVSRPIGGQ